MTVKKLLLVLTGVLVVVLVGTFLVVRSLSEPQPTAVAPNAVPYAYITEHQFVLRRGGQTIAQVPRIFDANSSLKNKVAWTPSGNYVAFLSDEQLRQDDTAKTQLIYVDTRTGEQRRMPCENCWDLTAAGTDNIIATRSNGTRNFFTQYRLNDNKKQGQFGDYPTDTGYPAIFLPGTKNLIYLHQGIDYPGGYYEQVIFGHPDTGLFSQPVLSVDARNDMPAAALSGADDTSDILAVATNDSHGNCGFGSPVILVDGLGKQTTTDQSAAFPSGAADRDGEGVGVSDLWWGPDRRLHASMDSWTCDAKPSSGHSRQLVSPPNLWRLDGTKWVKEDSMTADMLRPLDGTRRAALVRPNCIGPNVADSAQCNTGDLFELDGNAKTKIADDVLSISTPPRA